MKGDDAQVKHKGGGLTMQIATEEMRRSMGEPGGVVPRRPGGMDARIAVLDVFVRLLTLGRGQASRRTWPRGRVTWDGNIK